MKQAVAKEPKEKRSRLDAFVMSAASVMVSRASFYSDPSRTYASDEERKRAEIHNMMEKFKHYRNALEAYFSIDKKTCDDFRGMRECHEKIAEGYAEYYPLVLPYCMAALNCCIAIPIQDRKQDDFDAITRIFSNLLVAIKRMIQTLRVNHESVQNFLDFYLNNFLSLNQRRKKFLDLDGIKLDKFLGYMSDPYLREENYPFHTTVRIFLVVIRLFRTDTNIYDEELKKEIESLRALSIDPDPELKSVKPLFDIFLRALKLDEVLREQAKMGHNVEFQEPKSPSSVRK